VTADIDPGVGDGRMARRWSPERNGRVQPIGDASA
jgi:hypothetical protein